MNHKNIAAQLYTLRDQLTTPENIRRTLKAVRDIGYTAIQVSGFKYPDAGFMKDIIDELGLTVCVTHMPYQRLTDDLDGVIAEHRLWNCPMVGLGMKPDIFPNTLEGYKDFLRVLKPIIEKLRENGLKFGYHNHHIELEKVGGTIILDWLMEQTEALGMNVIMDFYWIQYGGGSPVKWIEKYSGRLDVVHLKDMAVVNSQQVMAEIGEGNLDWPAILAACRKAGVKWYAVEQDVCMRPPIESLGISYRYLETLMA